jgi:hypothetical protein
MAIGMGKDQLGSMMTSQDFFEDTTHEPQQPSGELVQCCRHGLWCESRG